MSSMTFKDLGIVEELESTIVTMGWTAPTKIQERVIPVALEGKDVIALAETGSGKTGAFAIPILQSLLANPQRLFALILTPTRELAFQISEQFEALGSSIGLKCVVIVGGVDNVTQAIALAKKPHIIIATPGRIVDHLENTKGFSIKSIKYLVMDEADRILNMDFEEEVDKIVNVCPVDRKTYLFSATMSSKVEKLQRASLKDPVRIEIATKYLVCVFATPKIYSRYSTVETLQQYYLFVPQKYKLHYAVYVLNQLMGNTFMIFTTTCLSVQKIALMLQHLNFSVVALHGQMDQNKRLSALKRFKAQQKNILVATDVASRGLDIPHVDVVINIDVPTQSKDYIHRVGRTARAGRSGRAVTIVSQYDIDFYQRIEKLINKKLPEFPNAEHEVMKLVDTVNEAERVAKMEIRDSRTNKFDLKPSSSADGVPEFDDVPGLPSMSSTTSRKRKQSYRNKNRSNKKRF